MKKIQVILESAESGWYGRIEGIGDFMPVTYGDTIAEIEKNLKELIEDHQQHDDPDDWAKFDLKKVAFEHVYDMTAFFQQFDFLKISIIAERAGMNRSLLRQYTTGLKYPSKEQVKRIEETVHQLGKEMTRVKIYA